MALPDRALVLKSHSLDLILSGVKTIEIRGRDHRFAGQAIYLLETKTGRVRGTARLGAARELAAAELEENRAALDALAYRRPRAWPLTEVQTLATSWQMSAQARQYCPTWVPRQRWTEFPATDAAAPPPTTTTRREDVASSLLQPHHTRRARRPPVPVENAPAGEDAISDPDAAVSTGPTSVSRASWKRPRLPVVAAAAAAATAAECRGRPASTAAEAPAASCGAGARPRPAAVEAGAGKKARLRSGPRANFALMAEDEEEAEGAEDDEGAVFAQRDREPCKAAVDPIDAVVSTGADDPVSVEGAERQASAGLSASAIPPSDLESLPEPLSQMRDRPKRATAMELLGALPRVAAAAADRRDGPASTAEEVPATIPDIEAVGKLVIRRLMSINSMSEKDPSDDGNDVWEEDTILDVVERVFATLDLEGTPADYEYRRVVFVKEGDETVSKLIPVEGTANAVATKEVVLCKKGG
jgi:hypothetical protein